MNRAPIWILLAGVSVGGASAQTAAPLWQLDAFEASFVQVPFSVVAPRECEFWLSDGTGELQILDCEGDLIGTVGRSGEGPGEYTWPRNLTVTDGAVVVWDQIQQRTTIVDLDTRDPIDVVRAGNVFNEVGGPTVKAGRLGGDVFVEVDGKPRGRPLRYPASFVLWPIGTEADSSVGPLVLDGPGYVVESDQVNTMAYHDPTTPRFVWDVSESQLIVADTKDGVLRVYSSLDGEPFTVRVDLEPARVTDAGFAEYLSDLEQQFEDELSGQSLGPDLRRMLRAKFSRIRDRIPKPEFWPLVEALYADPSGSTVAVKRPSPSESGLVSWSVVSLEDGSITATLLTSHTGEVIDAALWGDHLVTLEVDAEDYGVRRVSLYKIPS